MSAREELLEIIRSYEWGRGPTEGWPGEEEVLARFEREHAHELAEEIRREVRSTGKDYDASRWNRVVDFCIDAITP